MYLAKETPHIVGIIFLLILEIVLVFFGFVCCLCVVNFLADVLNMFLVNVCMIFLLNVLLLLNPRGLIFAPQRPDFCAG